MPQSHYVGFDPGGKKSFGWAVLSISDHEASLVATGTSSNAFEAMKAATDASPTHPLAVGVDAPLFWVADSDRNSDNFVRRMVCEAGGSSGTVNHVNSLRGACLVQGVMVARMAIATWKNTLLTESHPKALLAISSHARDFVSKIVASEMSEHERDAALAAFTALNFSKKTLGWKNLATNEIDPYHPVCSEVAYWFPGAIG